MRVSLTRWIGATGLLGFALFAGCIRAERVPVAVVPRYAGTVMAEERPYTMGMNYDPVDHALVWLSSGDLLIAHDERYSSADVYGGTCGGSGFFRVAMPRAAAVPVLTGRPACTAAQALEGVSATPDGRQVVFSVMTLPNNSRLAKLDLKTGELDTLATGCAIYLQEPAISPDGQHIAAVGQCADRDEDWGLYVLRVDGSGLRRVATHQQVSGPAAWHPGGDRFAIAVGDDHPPELAVVDAQGAVHRLGLHGWDPAWSPGGDWIAFIRPSGERDRLVITAARADGSGAFDIFHNSVVSTYSRGWGPRPEGEPSGPLVWSPDGEWLAFSRQFDSGTSVWKVKVSSGELVQVTAPGR